MTLPDLQAPDSALDVPLDVHAALFASQLATDRKLHLAFPGATDRAYSELAAILTARLLNNVGDPWTDGHGRNHTKPYEIDVVRRMGKLFGGGDTVWGYVASGATEGTIHAIDEAAAAYPNLVVFASTAAHYSASKAARLVRRPLALVRTDAQGRMSLDDLRVQLRRFRGRPVAIVATVGTTELEAVDDVAGIATLCQHLGITRLRLHVDAALAGVPLALLPGYPPFGFTAGATSIVVSGHKFLSTLMPCAVILYPQRPSAPAGSEISYIGATDTTIAGSRSGHTPLLLHWSLTTDGGFDGHRRRAEAARELAAYTYDRLRRTGWDAHWTHPAFTITLAQPQRPLLQPWVLGGDRTTGRIICMPGLQREWIDEFLADLAATHRGALTVPRPRRPRSTGGAQP
jgi:histidine decarboxylase